MWITEHSICLLQWSALHRVSLVRFPKLNTSDFPGNHNYIKILEADWSSAALIGALIVQLHTPCLSIWTVRVIKQALVALDWVIFFSI